MPGTSFDKDDLIQAIRENYATLIEREQAKIDEVRNDDFTTRITAWRNEQTTGAD